MISVLKNVSYILLMFFCLVTNAQKNKQPNVILFLVDDLDWKDGGALGSDLYETPNLDRLISEGTLFNNAYASCTVCSPTRASIMTGKYPAKLRVTDWIEGHKKPYAKMKIPDWNQKLDLEEITLAEAFKNRGYSTIHLGKWHLGEDEKYWPEHQGFDMNVGGHSAGSPKKRGGQGYFSPYKNPRMKDGVKGEYLTERLTQEAAAYIKNHCESPFFMNFWLYNVHLPLQAKKDKINYFNTRVSKNARHKNTTYAAMVAHMDDALGGVIKSLEKAGIYDNTIIVFHSDNGGIIGNSKNKLITDNFPLRSGKGDMYEGGVRVPMIFKWTSKIKAGVINETPVISTDIYPTLLSMVDNDYTPNSDIDGANLQPLLLQDKALERDAIYWHYPHYHPEGAKPYSAIRKGDWKLIQVYEEAQPQLYHLKNDIGETENLANQYPDKTKELLNDLNNWKLKVKAQHPTENLNYDAEKENFWLKKKH
ncbi:sulfatase [Wenyingzhuangia sp. IMCC45533]